MSRSLDNFFTPTQCQKIGQLDPKSLTPTQKLAQMGSKNKAQNGPKLGKNDKL